MKMSDVLLRAVSVVLTRSGDVSTEDGCFATCDTDEMIFLDSELSELFNLDSDDLELRHIPLIKAKAKDIDIKIESHDRLVEENKRLRQDILFLARSKQHNEIDSHYRLNALVSMAASTLAELDGEK